MLFKAWVALLKRPNQVKILNSGYALAASFYTRLSTAGKFLGQHTLAMADTTPTGPLLSSKDTKN